MISGVPAMEVDSVMEEAVALLPHLIGGFDRMVRFLIKRYVPLLRDLAATCKPCIERLKL